VFTKVCIGLLILITTHIGLSYAGVVPSEVSAFNQQVKEAVRKVNTIEYTRKGTDDFRKLETQTATPTPKLPEASDTQEKVGAKPTRLEIPAIELDASINNPTSTAISTLDNALRDGVVHYPSSGGVGGNRPMFLFAHSSRLPIVQNEAYKTFNNLDELSPGNEITVSGDGKTVRYRVTSVRVVDKDEAYVDFSKDSNVLALSTCSTFGAKENRVVVMARKVFQ
jgi:LPXTG-site transpeptidase (sortase) family protein